MMINNTAVFSQQFQITSYKEQIFQNIFATTLHIEKHYFSLPPFGRIIKLSRYIFGQCGEPSIGMKVSGVPIPSTVNCSLLLLSTLNC